MEIYRTASNLEVSWWFQSYGNFRLTNTLVSLGFRNTEVLLYYYYYIVITIIVISLLLLLLFYTDIEYGNWIGQIGPRDIHSIPPQFPRLVVISNK